MYAVGVGCLNEGIETVVHILLYGVVHAALAVRRACAVVVYSQSATAVNEFHVVSHLVELDIELRCLSEGCLYAAYLGYLATDMEMDELETVFHVQLLQLLQCGEEGFRRIERNMLHEVAEFENVVISCGGGTPCFFDNMDYLNLQSETVYLKATPEVLYAHLKMGKSVRPLLLDKTPEEVEAFVKQQLQQREPYYSKAKHVLDVNVLDSRDKVRVSVRKIRRMLKC